MKTKQEIDKMIQEFRSRGEELLYKEIGYYDRAIATGEYELPIVRKEIRKLKCEGHLNHFASFLLMSTLTSHDIDLPTWIKNAMDTIIGLIDE